MEHAEGLDRVWLRVKLGPVVARFGLRGVVQERGKVRGLFQSPLDLGWGSEAKLVKTLRRCPLTLERALEDGRIVVRKALFEATTPVDETTFLLELQLRDAYLG